MKKFYYKLQTIEGVVEAENMFDVILYLAETYYLESLDYISLVKDENVIKAVNDNYIED